MRLLALGDVITPSAVSHLASRLWEYRRERDVDFVTVNAENASFLSGIGEDAARTLLAAGADVLTGGNHSLQSRGVFGLYENEPRALRPLNYPADVPGDGCGIFEAAGVRILVMNAMGTALIEPVLDQPIPYIERALKRYEGEYDVSVLDFHAEATGEKYAVAHTFDGRISAIFGTHTHVPTADLQILPGGTGYVSDLGATAPTGGILGVKTEIICERFRTKLPISYKPAEGPVRAEGVIFDINERTGKTRSLERVIL